MDAGDEAAKERDKDVGDNVLSDIVGVREGALNFDGRREVRVGARPMGAGEVRSEWLAVLGVREAVAEDCGGGWTEERVYRREWNRVQSEARGRTWGAVSAWKRRGEERTYLATCRMVLMAEIEGVRRWARVNMRASSEAC